MRVSASVRSRDRQRARYLCEYCHSSEEASTSQFAIDHLQPKSLGGTDAVENSALACNRCNTRRYNFTTGIDPENDSIVSLFNPRIEQWNEHFK